MNKRPATISLEKAVSRTPAVAFAIVGLIAALVLVGWALDIEVFKSFLHPDHIAMNPMTAVTLLLGATCLWAIRREDTARRQNLIARIGGALILCLALSKLLDCTFGFHFHADQILFHSAAQNNTMAPNTAIALTLIGLGIFFLDLESAKRFHPAQAPIITAGCIGLLSLTGYIYRSNDLYELHGFIPMALNSAISIVLLSIGLLCARSHRQPLASILNDTLGGVVARRLIPAAFLVPLFAGRLELLGSKIGLYGPDFGLAVLVLMHIVVFNVLIWWCANAMRLSDLRRRETEQSLRDSDERHRAILEQAAEGIYLVDLETRVVLDLNPAMERLLGYAQGDATGKLIYEFIADTKENIDARMNKLAGMNAPLLGQRQYRRTDGTLIDIEASATVIQYGGRRVVCTVAHDVTDRNRAETLLRASEAQLRLVLETANDAFIAMDSAGKIIDWNPRAEQTFGWSHAEAMGRKLAETIIPPRFVPLHEKGLAHFLATGEGPVLSRRIELIAAYRDGREFPVELTISPALIGNARVFFSFIHDISARKRAEEERERFFTISSDIVATAGFDGYFKRVNPAFENLLGFTAKEICSEPWLFFVHPDDQSPTNVQKDNLVEGKRVLQFENRYRRKDGTYIWISWTSVPVVNEGLIYAIGHDMTERKEAERIQREAYQQLKETQSQLVQSEKLAGLGQMVAGVAHEINNPLSFVANNVAVVQRDMQSLTQLVELYTRADSLLETHNAELINEIRSLSHRVDLTYTRKNMDDLLARSREGLRRIQQIVKDLRDFARLDESDFHEVDLNSGIQSTINIVAGKAKKKRIKIDLELGGLPFVSCYPAKINQVVMNLVANAIDAAPEGGHVVVKTAQDNGQIHITVADNGPGVPSNIRGQIFDPFFTTKPVGEGTGLGLSISYGIIRDHHGTIDVTDAPDGGAIFQVIIPRQGIPKPPAIKPA